MKKTLKLVIVLIIFLGLLIPSIGTVDIDNDVITAGDTFLYDIRKFDVPWEDLFSDISGLLGYRIENVILDLSGSTFGVKVMGTDNRNGYYMLNPYIIFGKDFQIPIFEDSLDPEIEDIFGDVLVLPEGVGFGIGTNIPGSDYLEFIDSDYENFPGLPFYFDAEEWAEYEDMFEDFSDILHDADTGLKLNTDEQDDEFIITVEGIIGGGAQNSWETITEPWWWTEEYTTEPYWWTDEYPYPNGGPEIEGDISFEFAWHASGDHAGVFKRVKGDFNGDIGEANNLNMEIEVEFDKKRHNPLPEQIINEETIDLEMDAVEFYYDTTGYFADHEDFQDQLDEIEDTLSDAEDEDMFEFEITNVEGCYYETDIQVYEGEDSEGVWWNGFIGAPGWKDDWMEDPWDDWYIYAIAGRMFPLAAPGVTPDWDMWQASTLSISSILEFVEKAVTSSAAEDVLGDMGITLNTFEIQYEMRGNKDFVFFYFTGEVDLEFDSTEYVDWPSEDPEEPKVEAKADVEVWLGYTREGLIASIGVNLNVRANFEEFPFSSEYNYETYEYETYYDDGSIELELNAEMNNKDIRDIPNPTSLPDGIQKTTSESSIPESTHREETSSVESSGYPVISPSFSLIPALIILAAFAVIFKRKGY